MFIDILYIVLLVIAVFKGLSRGLIVAVVSFFAVMIGLAAAVKLSAKASLWVGESTQITSKWLPFISFIAVMVLVIIAVRMLANILQKAVELMFAGWANKLGGIILYAVIYTMVYSVLLFYATKMNFISSTVVADSVTYHFIEPWGSTTINIFGELIPIFKGLFLQLETFFGRFA